MGHTITVDGTDLAERFGPISRFAETLPQPKVIKVSIPAGLDLDITDSLGRVGFSDGEHRFDVYLLCETERERVEAERAIVAMLQGRRLDYELSWDEGYTYTGRFVLEFGYLNPHQTRVGVKVSRSPWKVHVVEEHVIDCHPSATHQLEGSSSYHDIEAVMLQGGSTQVGSETAVARAAAGTYELADGVYSDLGVTVTVSDWLFYADDYDLVVNESKFSQSGSGVTIDASYEVTDDGDIYFADADLQLVTVKYARWDM